MKGLSALFITLLTPIKDAIRVIDQGAAQIALVVDSQQRLLGVITDGDIRRGILRGVRMDETVDHVMRREFRSVSEHVSSEEVLALMGAESLHLGCKNERPLAPGSVAGRGQTDEPYP